MINEWLIVLLCKVAGSDLNFRDNGMAHDRQAVGKNSCNNLVKQQGPVKDS